MHRIIIFEGSDAQTHKIHEEQYPENITLISEKTGMTTISWEEFGEIMDKRAIEGLNKCRDALLNSQSDEELERKLGRIDAEIQKAVKSGEIKIIDQKV